MQRFWTKVKKAGLDECWLWTAGERIKGKGYGGFHYQGRIRLAHCVAYELTHGNLPDGSGYHGTVVRHTCDNPRCVNPAHLMAGTQGDNIRDAASKGRMGKADVRGEKNPMCRFSDVDVIEMKQLRAKGLTQQAIADRFGTHQATVSLILSGRRRSA